MLLLGIQKNIFLGFSKFAPQREIMGISNILAVFFVALICTNDVSGFATKIYRNLLELAIKKVLFQFLEIRPLRGSKGAFIIFLGGFITSDRITARS